ncbi:Asp23/Gls24 family envelope stress response protein [Nocardia blacklockiae]|uniref:Asp23/Gls24 family envelope stress response protein n=1 Tax=Nocardia blacklockiae TaxID=480036 RepID=UPI001895784C|nr:Asp23/Gls24 family envelope stress response protein [Nocardia blacklockiae]MBF6174870.1 Asp23/Gls24 family envelope stress response protein [Nocardia blacklockiae]
MTSTVTAIEPATAPPVPAAEVDAAAVRRVVIEAAREITGVAHDVQAHAKLVRGAAVLSLRLPIHYPMPIWQVATVCRAHVLRRVRERTGMPVRRLEIDVAELPETGR